jgi:hypothetical protein
MHGHTIPLWGFALILISGVLFGAGGLRLFGARVTIILAVIVAVGIYFLVTKGS